MLDLVIRNARLAGRPATTDGAVDIGIAGGRIAAIDPAGSLPREAPWRDAEGCLATAGLVETHIHLDKSCLNGRCSCGASLAEAVANVAAAKRGFTEADVTDRARRTLELAIVHGTTRMRTQLEVDPRIGLTSLHAIRQLKRDYAWAIELQICVFPQEGLLDDPGCETVLEQALTQGADLIGGAPYMDRDSHGQIARIAALAQRYDLDIDLHLDFSLDTTHLDIDEVCRVTEAIGWGGRVAIGHVSKLSALSPDRAATYATRLANAGVALTVMPATDLFLMGRDQAANIPRGLTAAHRFAQAGVTCSIATNNVQNPFTPFGDASLIRMANLYANIAQIGTPEDLEGCLDLVTTSAARLMRLDDYGIVINHPADVVVFDAPTPAEVIAGLAPPVFGLKRGKLVFEQPRAKIYRQG